MLNFVYRQVLYVIFLQWLALDRRNWLSTEFTDERMWQYVGFACSQHYALDYVSGTVRFGLHADKLTLKHENLQLACKTHFEYTEEKAHRWRKCYHASPFYMYALACTNFHQCCQGLETAMREICPLDAFLLPSFPLPRLPLRSRLPLSPSTVPFSFSFPLIPSPCPPYP